MLRMIQHAGRWFFHRADALFNQVFGDRLNPLYYLGAITYWLLWVVVATGLYLYIFFRTGIEEAYSSVEYLTVQQWWLGGVMRSVHRYASDALVLAMLLHLTRHFVFDNYRSFRWFSWITGVMLIWLTYASGINGYMLPWDKLAQFVVIATAEWFDWLPAFGGTLIRNFIAEGAVNDRLWSLLSFIHIGLPLALLAVLWIHTQRVAGAHTVPPWPIAIGTTVALIALALVRPVTSQGGPADLSAAITTIDLDWFYLPAYALLYRWSPAELWWLIGGGTLLFLAAPWLPPRRRSTAGFHVLVHPDNRIIPVREGEHLLEAALREGMPVPFECRNGGCGMCKGTLLYGSVDYGLYQDSALPAEERATGKLLLCCATPLTDLEIEYVPTGMPGNVPVRVFTARVAKMARLAHDVMQLTLKVQGDQVPSFYAGQYINIFLPDGEKRSFSFATAPHQRDHIELQIRLVPGGRFTTRVFNEMKEGDTLQFEGPLGSFFLREDSSKPIIFVAGATGFAPVKSMVEHAFYTGMKRRMYLYWGARRLHDLYLADLPRQWAREHDNFVFVPVLSEPAPEDRWGGRTGLVHQAILADFPDLSEHQIYACGSVAMVETAHPAFVAHGMSEHDCFSDAFKLAPQLRAKSAEMVRLGGAP
ncbi:MAG: ferredoxin-NAD reductase [Betaproteobacteria bacterium RIFCSPLOWO2_02_64_14]|nr:MAG: ferredoxin-NAD reductase [Betaproteobacteria bacterium RIFCSPLOWO2_02_64_14]